MLKKCMVFIATAVVIAAIFIALGGAEENPMLGFGLSLTLIAGLVTMGLSTMSKMVAMRVQFEPTEAPENKQSSRFTHTHQLQGLDNQKSETFRLLQDVSASVDELEQKVSSMEFDQRALKNHVRICFDNIRYHEIVTLPQALASSWGGTVMSTVVGLVGAVIAAFPQAAFQYAQSANALLQTAI
ncbi:hypothetical protein EA797_04475 [Stutzerimonas zhaodongensis]|uniref:Uncharacterized protein n=1 Tax=Stutzerimonas zhaodongensis TaxID=1176257 RepID=A0A3M2HW06_9GAMM|nr:hypothetical protein [Stutzerimonas zhaodongensis]MCQ4314474.1 hypothetical protein [Stutzerimonas zhaodongensis]RMH91993.1 hypothetical protein EA797_04475 [Stutzerimonas zhaodongensis]